MKPNKMYLFFSDGIIEGWGYLSDHNVGIGWSLYRNKGVWEKSSKFSKQVKTNL